MRVTTFGLGVDVGSAATKAVLATPDGGRVPLAVEGVVRMPSGVFVDPGGALMVGQAARSAMTWTVPDLVDTVHNGQSSTGS